MSVPSDDRMTALLYSASDDAPPSRLDLGLAVRDGRRQRRRRLVIVPAAAALVVLGLAGGFAIAIQPQGDKAPGYTAATSTIAAPVPAPTTFDPQRLRLSVGWVPPGYRQADTTLRETQQSIFFLRSDAPHSPITVTLNAAGVRPWEEPVPAPPARTTTAAEPVGGRSALWLSLGGVTYALAWEWAPGGWAVVTVPATEPAETRQILRRIAENVGTDLDQLLRFPFTVAMPQPWRHVGTGVSGVNAGLSFANPGTPDSTSASANEGRLGIQVAILTERARNASLEPNQIIAGHPAFVQSNEDFYWVVLFDVNGYKVSVMVDAEERAFMSDDQANEVALSVVPLGTLDDTSQWTTDPVR